MNQLIKQLNFMKNSIDLKEALKVSSSVILYGAGNVGRDVLELLTNNGNNVLCFLDKKDLKNSFINGIPVIKPDKNNVKNILDVPVVLSFFNAYVDVLKIISFLTALGFKKVYTFLDLHHIFSEKLGRRFWLIGADYYTGKEKHIEDARTLWKDEKSRILYDSIINFRLTRDYTKLLDPEIDKQYFPDDVPAWNYPLNLIDCGAFDGDTIREIVKKNIQFEKIVAFEPDQNNFNVLAAECSKINKEFILFPCGTWSHTEQLRFASGYGTGSAISSNGDTLIQCVSIDQSIPNFKPNLIKMDIEGAELASLIGAKNTIKKYCPGLAICLYHNPEHIWQIPKLLSNWELNYDFYLRCHCYSTFELVMYAVPRA
jgi:FkbM family methyltransferase